MSNQSRVQAGVPTGGQYAMSAHAEAQVSLEDLADAYLDLDASGADHSERDALSETIQNAYDSARHWEHRKGVRERSRGVVDIDDIAQEAMLSVLERQANGRVVQDPKGYIHTSAWGIAQQAGNQAVRAEDRKALKMYRDACEKRALSEGRRLTPQEEDDIATAIREDWHDPRHKPSTDFRRYMGQMEVSMHSFETSDAADYFMPKVTMPETGERGVNDVEVGSFTDRALDAVEGHGGSLRDARRMLYNALAEHSEAPLVEGGTLSQRRVTSARSTMGAYPGGVAGALRAWDNGTENEATEALFAPWGEDATTDQKDAVSDLMRRFPDRAEDLWDSALKLANTRNADRT